MTVKTLVIDGQDVSGQENASILDVAREHDIFIPTLCFLEGLTSVGACRMCLVEVEGSHSLLPACVTTVQEGMVVNTCSDRLDMYRRTILEMLFTEGNHICAVCVSNGHCELQSLAARLGMDHSELAYLSPDKGVDISHYRFGLDHNRCILCSRCVRVCQEIEGAHTWDIMGRGIKARVITDLAEPWGESETCTSCAKCIQVCPTGALFNKSRAVGEQHKQPRFLEYLKHNREGGK